MSLNVLGEYPSKGNKCRDWGGGKLFKSGKNTVVVGDSEVGEESEIES